MAKTPSVYQQALFDTVWENNWKNIMVEAVAGSGKSTTGIWMYDFFPANQDIMFCAFNKSIQLNLAAKGVTAKTYHALGLGGITNSLGRVQIDADKVEKMLKNYLNRDQYGFLYPPIKRLVSLCKNTLIEPTNENLWELALYHNIDLYSDNPELPDIVFDQVRFILDACKKQTATVDFDDMVWLPIALDLPVHKYNILLVDEYQDTNMAQQELALKSGERIIGFGDQHQCQPADTVVALSGGGYKTIAELEVGDYVLSYDRHGSAIIGRTTQGRRVDQINCRPFTGNLYHITSNGHTTKCTPNHKWLVRFGDKSTKFYVTYMMRKGHNFRVGWCQLFTSNGMNHLAQRARIEHADEAWILNVFTNKHDASLDESYIATVYGLPTIMFQEAAGNELYTQDNLNKLFDRIIRKLDSDKWRNTPTYYGKALEYRAAFCLLQHNRDIDFPFYQKSHQTRRGRKTLFVTETCNLIPEIMSIPSYNGSNKVEWKPLTMKIEPVEDEMVYSLQVATHEMYIADGLVTHNSIYGFRGADVDAIPRMIERLGATTMPLSITYRNPKSVVQLVNTRFPNIKFEATDWAQDGKVETIKSTKFLESVTPGDMILCRVNAPMLPYVFQLLREGKKATILGRDIGQGLISLIKKMKCFDLESFFPALQAYVDKETWRLQLAERYALIQLLQDKVECIHILSEGCNSVADLIRRIETIFSDETPGITFSSVHKAKGLEAQNVYILHPELMPHPLAKKEWEKVQEENCLYVALTRSSENLYFVE